MRASRRATPTLRWRWPGCSAASATPTPRTSRPRRSAAWTNSSRAATSAGSASTSSRTRAAASSWSTRSRATRRSRPASSRATSSWPSTASRPPTRSPTTSSAPSAARSGTVVSLTIKRHASAQTSTIQVTRAEVHVPSVRAKVENGIAYVRLADFGSSSADEVRGAFLDAKKQGAHGYILDLRNNGGGLLDAAVDISSLFIPQGPIVSTIDRAGNRDVRRRDRQDDRRQAARAAGQQVHRQRLGDHRRRGPGLPRRNAGRRRRPSARASCRVSTPCPTAARSRSRPPATSRPRGATSTTRGSSPT